MSDYVSIADIEYEKLPLVCSSCKMIGHNLSECRRQLDTNTGNTFLPKFVVVQYKLVVA